MVPISYVDSFFYLPDNVVATGYALKNTVFQYIHVYELKKKV